MHVALAAKLISSGIASLLKRAQYFFAQFQKKKL